MLALLPEAVCPSSSLVYLIMYLNAYPAESLDLAKLFGTRLNSSVRFRAFALCLNIFFFI